MVLLVLFIGMNGILYFFKLIYWILGYIIVLVLNLEFFKYLVFREWGREGKVGVFCSVGCSFFEF